MDCLIWLSNIIVDMWEIRGKKIIFIIVTQDLVNNSIFSLHLEIWLWLKGRGMVISVKNGKFVLNGKLSHSCAGDEEQAL